MRNCGRHACGRVCCPLAVVALQRKGGKGKKRMQQLDLAEVDDAEGWHTCDLVCNSYLFYWAVVRWLTIVAVHVDV